MEVLPELNGNGILSSCRILTFVFKQKKLTGLNK